MNETKLPLVEELRARAYAGDRLIDRTKTPEWRAADTIEALYEALLGIIHVIEYVHPDDARRVTDALKKALGETSHTHGLMPWERDRLLEVYRAIDKYRGRVMPEGVEQYVLEHLAEVLGIKLDYDYRCEGGHDRCDQMYPGPECPCCERVLAEREPDPEPDEEDPPNAA